MGGGEAFTQVGYISASPMKELKFAISTNEDDRYHVHRGIVYCCSVNEKLESLDIEID